MRSAVGILLSLLISVPALAYPKPSLGPVSWELKFQFQDIQRINIVVPGEPARAYWYMIYTITNDIDNDRDVMFYPEFSLVTDELKVFQAGLGVPPEVFQAIKRRYKNTYPWLEHPRDLIGKIRRGQDNARDSVAIWPDFDPRTSKFAVFVAGLSGEQVTVGNPLSAMAVEIKPMPKARGKIELKKKPKTAARKKKLLARLFGRSKSGGSVAVAKPAKTAPKQVPVAGAAGRQPKEFVLRKTLRIQYTLPADPASRDRVHPIRSGRPPVTWVMR